MNGAGYKIDIRDSWLTSLSDRNFRLLEESNENRFPSVRKKDAAGKLEKN